MGAWAHGRTCCSTARQGFASERAHVTNDVPHFPREIALRKRAASSRRVLALAISALAVERYHTTPPPSYSFALTETSTMARLNTHLSATPQTRASTVDSLYRDPSVAPRHGSTARGSTYSVLSPSQSSDKENMDQESRDNTPSPTSKRKGLSNASGRIPTPDTGSTIGSTNNKRRRTGTYHVDGDAAVYEDEVEEEEDDEEEDADAGEAQSSQRQPTTQPEEDEDSQNKLYNPNQDPEKRRRVRYQLRDHHRQLEGRSSKKY